MFEAFCAEVMFPLFIRKLNDIAVDHDGQLDLVLKKSSKIQHICNKTIGVIHFGDDVNSLDYFDGVNLNNWSNAQRVILKSNEIEGPIHTRGFIKANKGVLGVEKSLILSDYDVINVLQSAGSLLAEKLPGQCNVIFESLKVVKDSVVGGHINQVSPSIWVPRNSPIPVVLQGVKEFENNIHLKRDSKTEALLSSVDPGAVDVLQILSQVLFNGVEQTLDADWEFRHGLQVDKLNCPGLVLNGVPFEDIWMRDMKMQVVQVPTEVKGFIQVTDSLVVKSRLNTALLYGIPLNPAIADTLRTKGTQGPQVFTGRKGMNKVPLEVMKNLTIHGLTNGFNLDQLLATILREDIHKIDQVNYERVILDHPLSIERIDYSGFMNGIVHEEWGRNWMLKTGSQIVEAPLIFHKDLSAREVFVHDGMVSSIDIQKLNQEIQRTDQGGLIEMAHFHDVVHVTPNVFMAEGALVNTYDLQKDVLLKNTTRIQKLSGNKDFRNGWTVHGDLTLVKRFPYGFDYGNAARFVLSQIPQRREKLFVRGNVWMLNEPLNSKDINGILWSNILSSVWFANRPAVFLHKRVGMSSMILKKGALLDDGVRISGMDLKDLQMNYASTTKNQTWSGVLTFHDGIDADVIGADNISVVHGLFQGVHMVPYSLSIMYNIHQTIEQDIHVNTLVADSIYMDNGAMLNGVIFPHGFMLVHAPKQVVPGVKIFGSLFAEVAYFPRGMQINGILMENWNRLVATVAGANEIRGEVIFEDIVFYDNIE